MLNLLDKSGLNKLNMLHILDETEQILSIDDISLKLNLDKRTVHSIIGSIQNDIVELGAPIIIKYVKKDNLIVLEKNDDFNLQIFILFYLKESLNFNLCTTLFNNTFTTSVQFSKSNYVSLSTLKNKSENLKKLLKSFDLTLALNTNNLINGEEKQIRHFYFYFFWTSYKTTEWPFKEINFKEIKKYIYKHIEPSYSFSFTDIYKFILGLSISINRIKQGYIINHKPIYTKVKNSNIPFDDFHLLIASILAEFGITDNEIIQLESEFLYFSISLLGIFPIQNYTNLNLTHLQLDSIEDSTKYVNFWITEFCSFFSITISVSEYHYLEANLLILFNKILYLKGPSSNFGILISEDQLIENYPYYFENINSFIHHLNKFKYFKKINQSDNYLIDYYVLFVWQILKKMRPKLKIAVQSSFSLLHMDILKDDIITLSPVPLLFSSDITSDTTLIITDVAVPEEFSLGKEVFIWNTFPTKKQFNLLKYKLVEKYKKQFP